RLAEVELPDSARDVVRRRIALLPAQARRVLEAASVLGPQFALGTLGSMLEIDNAALLAALDRAVFSRLLVREDEGVGRYAFVHVLVRDTIYGDLPTTSK